MLAASHREGQSLTLALKIIACNDEKTGGKALCAIFRTLAHYSFLPKCFFFVSRPSKIKIGFLLVSPGDQGCPKSRHNFKVLGLGPKKN